jgi:hypothetical protein
MHYDWLTFIIAALAVMRVARMITEEDGPWFLFKRFRDSHDDSKSSFDVGIRCFYCVSWWAALAAAAWLVIFGGWDAWLFPVWWAGIGGAAIIGHRYWNAKA